MEVEKRILEQLLKDLREEKNWTYLYFVPSDNFVMAKTNSYQEGLNSIHATLIKWACYVTGVSLKIGYVGFYVIITLALIGSLLFFAENANEVLTNLRKGKG